MAIINLRDYYPFYTSDCFMEVSDEVAEMFKEFDRKEAAYEMLLDLVWHEDYTYYSRKAINNHISNLRKKLRVAPGLPDYVKSVYGVGYKFDV